ncbi:MAG TPA: ABC transporter ATP-binding protein [Thermomicrobiales bacterium]|nr:ABC transporter ATP-binding protein [Thermomicrobiales bacterium]
MISRTPTRVPSTSVEAPPPPISIPTPIIEARGLEKRYGDHLAVDGLDLAVLDGEIFGILGPNGAGKTTTLEMIEGLRAPDAGEVRVAGFDPVADGDKVRRLIGVQLQSTALFDYLSVAELVELFAGLYDVDGSPTRVASLIGLVGLAEKARARVAQLSGGQRQRVAIALALVNDPRIVVLDEPTTGLDPIARRALWATIRSIRDGGATVVLTTHSMDEAETLCDRVAVMDRGRVIACDAPAALVRALGTDATIRARAAGGLDVAALAALPGVVGVEAEGVGTDNSTPCEHIRLRSANAQATLLGLLALAEAEGSTLTDLSSTQATLEDVFLALTGRGYEPGEEPPPEAATGRRGRAG